MRLVFTLIFFTLCLTTLGQQKEVCFTFDDLPVVTYRNNSHAFKEEVTEKLIATLIRFEIPAIGFVNEQKLYTGGQPDSLSVNLLKKWLENGMELGNHTFSHPDYHKVPFSDYTTDILKGEQICKPLAQAYNSPYKYFRHPFLRAGKTRETNDSLNRYLAQHAYTVVPVTIDNNDYLFAFAYEKAMHLHDTLLMEEIGREFIAYMEKKLKFYEEASMELFNRNISQILLLHANSLNADYLDELSEMFIQNGYNFVSPEEALSDPAYNTEITRYGDWGISWIDRWALSRGMKEDFFQKDPDTPELIKRLTKK